MSRIEGRVDDVDDASAERTIKFVLTLIVATLIVAVAVYVLSAPLVGPGSNPAAHRAAMAAFHAHS